MLRDRRNAQPATRSRPIVRQGHATRNLEKHSNKKDLPDREDQRAAGTGGSITLAPVPE